MFLQETLPNHTNLVTQPAQSNVVNQSAYIDLVPGEEDQYICYVAYPLDLFEEGSVTNMFTSIVGNVFGFKALRALHLEDLPIPIAYIKTFQGPPYGIQGVASVQQENYSERYQGYTATGNNVGYVSQNEVFLLLFSANVNHLNSPVLHSTPSAHMSFVFIAFHRYSHTIEAWYPNTGSTLHVTYDQANLQTGALYTDEAQEQNSNDLTTIFSTEQLNVDALALQNCGSRHVSPEIRGELSEGSQLVLDNGMLIELQKGSNEDIGGDELQVDAVQVQQSDVQVQLSDDQFQHMKV
ncbi:hypothetical protein V6N11_043133 [Hibiscus sabdariffa]|uniref:Ribulose bisphosphate carboxylase large chain n=1 Tax=Hibiscus sabdariffa TaxID=183260 RepID=A0ABR2QYD6_9ROSI